MKKIRCIGMDEGEVQKAVEILSKRPSFGRGGYSVTGLAEETEIARLEHAGLIVEVVPEETQPIGWLEPDPEEEAAQPAPLASGAPRAYGRLAAKAKERYVIQFTGPLGEDDRLALRNLGVKLGAYVPGFAYKAPLSAAQTAAVKDLGFVQRVVYFSPWLRLRRARFVARRRPAAQARRVVAEVSLEAPPELRCKEAPGVPLTVPVPGKAIEAPGPESLLMWHLACHDRADLPALADELAGDARVKRVERGRNRLRISAAASDADALLADISSITQVANVEPYEHPVPQTAFARIGIGIDAQEQLPWLWDGTGEIVGVIDSGVDTRHPDLVNRVIEVIEKVPPEAPDDPFGHGTHVMSIICGDGTASGGACRGVAPGAKAIVQSIRDANGAFSGIPVDMGELFHELYQRGARIVNASWGNAVGAIYTTDAYELDHFIYENPDCLIVVAAGNSGQQPNPLDPRDPLGRILYESLASPASAKNALSVGACCSPRTDGPYAGKPWKLYQGSLPSPQFPPLAEAPICGNPDVVAAFSSRGPTDDQRVKPDLLAPGTVILGAKSSRSTPRQPEAAFGGHYAYQSGTSMAAPVVAGGAAIVRQYYVREAQHASPSAALLKATLINGATRINWQLAEDENVGYPNFHQGFGRLNMRRTLPLPGNANGFTLRFVDINTKDPGALNGAIPSKSVWKKQIQVGGKGPLRITLCWTDYPAHGLQNYLDLVVQSPSNVRVTGNPEHRRLPWAKTDRANNVERIVIAEPAAGIWVIMVNASNTPFPPQGFSLVVTGHELSTLF
jgi:subtilisin family serine protease